jgi:hypothetical protein
MHAEIMNTRTQTDILAARTVEEHNLIEEHYITQINQAIGSGRDDLIDELVTMREVETARSTPPLSLFKRAARHATR